MSMPQAQKEEKHQVPQEKKMHLKIKKTKKKSHLWARWKTSSLDAYTMPSNRPTAVSDRTSGF